MPRDDQLERIRSIADRVARSHGLELFDVQFRRESIGWVLRIVLDRRAEPAAPLEEGVTLEHCQHVSRDVSAILDVEDPVERHYTLEVSSPGLDRPLRGAEDYRRFVGRLARVTVSAPIGGQKRFAGRLKGLDHAEVVLEGDRGRVHRIPLDAIVRARLEVEA